MRFLVTGGAGFIGSHLVARLLSEGHEVEILDDFNDFYDPKIKRENVARFDRDVRVHEIDLCDAAKVGEVIRAGGFDQIVHLAARAGVRPSIDQPRLYLETNITGTFNLLESAQLAGIGKFIFASSSSVYGASKKVPFSEDQALTQTLSPYAATKLAGEQLCGNFTNLYGMRTVCLRFFTVYGPGQRPDLAIHKFTRMIWNGEPIPKFGEGHTRRDYTYIEDILDGIEGAIAHDGEPFDIFNLGESETTTLNELIEVLEKAIGREAVIDPQPLQKGDMPLTCADISKARRLLGYSPRTKIAEGIPKFVAWYRAMQP